MFQVRSFAVAIIAAFISVSAFASVGASIPGEVIVKYKSGSNLDRNAMTMLYNATGVKKVRRFSTRMGQMEHLILKDGVKSQDAIAALLKNKAVAFAQPNYILRLPKPVSAFDKHKSDGVPCIPGFDIPGCDPNACLIPGIFPPGCTGGGGGGGGGGGNTRPALKDAPADVNPPVADPSLAQAYGLSKIGATEAWTTYNGNKAFVVADIDTGIDYNHEDLAFNVWRNPNPTDQHDIVGFDFIHNDGLPFDDQSHGTHTAGTIGATGGNGVGVSGVSQRVSIMALKFLSAQGSGSTADAIRAIDYAVAHGARVLSNSWGGSGEDGNAALEAAIVRARDAGVLFVAAAGNDGVDNDSSPRKSYPAAFTTENMLVVAATDSADRMASFSNYGRMTTHLGAPGVDVYSTIPNNQYKKNSGTSMACPHVAGAAALIWSKTPSMTYQQVKAKLMSSADPIASLSGKTVTGGRLNVLKALRN